jgi:arylsulfatase B
MVARGAAVAVALCAHLAAGVAAQAVPPPPRVIVYILADDTGYGNLGFAPNSPARRLGPNGTSLTPNLDALASQGLVLSNHVAHFMCTPSRCSFLTGRLPVHVQQGQDFPETPHAGIPRNMTTFANKLQAAGWSTHIAGKYDAGMATRDHTPEGRGFNTSLVFWEHMADSYSQQIFPGGTACTLVNPSIVDLWSNGGPARGINGTGFVEDLFINRVLSTIQEADDPVNGNGPPLFIYYAPKVLHYPLEVPPAQLAKYAWVLSDDDEPECNATTPYISPGVTGPYNCRRQGWALVGMLDDNVQRIVDALAARGWWRQSLLVLASDNGAPLDLSEAGGTNFPLRGGKYAPWSGGVRVPALVTGGALPLSVRGTVDPSLVHIADFYATFCAFAGVDPTDHKAAAAGLPPIDSLDLWPLITGTNATSPRTEVPIAPGALISWPYKLVRGLTWWSGYSGEIYPNASSTAPNASPDIWVDCGNGCLYDLVADETESVDLAASQPQLVVQLSARLDVLEAGFFSNNDTAINPMCPPNVTLLCGCWAADNIYGGYFGPYQY